jgi:hypothetical protein
MTAVQQKVGTLLDWVASVFGAEDIQNLDLEVGSAVQGVWRPSLYVYEDISQALGVSATERRLSENALRLLVQKLDELFLYIEPDVDSLQTYSHKTRELLILACTEVENFWQYYTNLVAGTSSNRRTSTTRDYVKLVDKLYLREYQFTLNTYSAIPPVRPFQHWSSATPTASLAWYDAYNKTKHDREKHFKEATLSHCISAVVANLVLYCVKFSPFPLLEQSNAFTTLINQHFEGELVDVSYTNFYVHKIHLPADNRDDLFIYDHRRSGDHLPFTTQPLVL